MKTFHFICYILAVLFLFISCDKDENTITPNTIESFIKINGDYQSLTFESFPFAWRICRNVEHDEYSTGTVYNVFGMAIDPTREIDNFTVGGLIVSDYFGIGFMEIIPTAGVYEIVDPNLYENILDVPEGKVIIQFNEDEFYAQSGKVIVSTDSDLSAWFENVTFKKHRAFYNENVDSFIASGAIRCDN